MNSRRTLATLTALAVSIGTASAFAAPQPLEARPIQIESGKVLGVLTQDQKVIAYKGIPFAQPPIEDLRWRAPQPVHKWRHVFLASDFGHHCIQSSSYPDMVFHDSGPSEVCLSLNVWAPSDA